MSTVSNVDQKLPFILGIAGDIGAGKDTVANILRALTRSPVLPFAMFLKQGAIHKFNLDPDRAMTREGKDDIHPVLGISTRDIFRLEGTEAGRDVYGDDIWVKMLQHLLSTRFARRPLVIVPDVRFSDGEVGWVRSNGVLLHIRRNSNPYEGDMSAHRSDAGVPYEAGDLEINNTNITFSDLTSRLLSAIRMHPGLNRAVDEAMANWLKD